MSNERNNLSLSLTFLISCFFSLIFVAFSSNFPSKGCYWTEECVHKWRGECDGLVYNQSSNCYGNCQGREYSPCAPDHTHFYCCVAGSPMKVKDGCKKCENKMDDGDEYVCCSDCTYPEMIYGDSSSGYCKSGADLISQTKPKEVFRWVAGPWLSCSAPCGGGVRSRRVDCFSVIEDTSTLDYPVYDELCFDQEKLISQEPCNLQSCVNEVLKRSKESKRDGKSKSKTSSTYSPLWITFFLLLIGGLGFTLFILYKRKTSSQTNDGYVYIMMDGFS